MDTDIYREKTMGRHRENMAICKQKNKALEETNSAYTLSPNFYPPELGENKFLVFKPLSLWFFVTAA